MRITCGALGRMIEDEALGDRTPIAITCVNLWTPFRTTATDQPQPMGTVSHACDRQFIPDEATLARLRQTVDTPWKLFRTSATYQPTPMQTVLHVCGKETIPNGNCLARLQ